MFRIAVNNLVQSIGDDVYLPSPSIAASQNLTPLSLVEREGGFLPLSRSNNYYTTDFTLNDIIAEDNVKLKMEDDQPLCTYNRESTVKTNGKLGGTFKGIFDADVERVDELTIKTNFGSLIISEVDISSLLQDVAIRKLNMHHELLRELSANRWRALCVVTGVVKTKTDVTITASMNKSLKLDADDTDDESEGSKKVESIGTIQGIVKKITSKIVDADVKAVHEKNSERSLVIPAGTVLAYQVMELAVNGAGEERLMVSHGSKGGFSYSKTGFKRSETTYATKVGLLFFVIGVGLAAAAAYYSLCQLKSVAC